MSPALSPLHAFELGRLAAPSLARRGKAMQIQSRLHSRASNGGLGQNTIIFVVLGVVCFFVILIGFYFVSRPRATSNASPNVPSIHQDSSTVHTPRSQSEPGMSKRWRIWRIWRHTNCTQPDPATPISQPSPAPAAISKPSRIGRIRRGPSRTYPPIVVRPSHSRRPTNLSVATSFPHSHVSEEAWSELRASAYDLDVDLETEMLHSARDDVWLGHPLAVEGGVSMEEVLEEQGNAAKGGDSGNAHTRPTLTGRLAQLGDYENSGACRGVPTSERNTEGNPIEDHKT